MAFTATTQTDYASFLKELYKGSTVADLCYDSNAVLALLPKNPNTGGTKYIKPIRYSFVNGRGADFATARANVGAADRDRWEMDWTNHYTIAAVTNKAMELASGAGQAGSFKDLLVDEVDSAHQAFGNDVEIELHNDGTGVRGVASGVIASLWVPLGAGQASNFDKGMNVVHLDASDVLLDSGEVQVVTAVDRSGDRIKLDADWTGTNVVATHKIVLSGDQNAKAKGFKAWLPGSGVAATAFNGVDRTGDATRLAGVDGVKGTLSGLLITDGIVQTTAQIIRQGGKPNLALISAADFADLSNETEARGRYAKVDASTGTVSFSAIEIATPAGLLPVVADRHTESDEAFILDTRKIEVYSTNALPSLFNKDGSFYHRTETADELSFYLYGFYGMSIQEPGSCSWVQDLY
jgi:hypothetical protein